MSIRATVVLSETSGNSVVNDSITNCNFGGADTPNLAIANNPIVRSNTTPARVNSFHKCWRIKVSDMGDSSALQGFKFWRTSGDLVNGERLFWLNTGGFSIPDITNLSSVDVPASYPASTNISIGGDFAGIIVAPGYTDYWRVQNAINVGALTPLGVVNPKTLVVQFDES